MNFSAQDWKTNISIRGLNTQPYDQCYFFNVMSLTAWERTLCSTECCIMEHSPSLPDDARFLSSAHLANCCVKWVWISDCWFFFFFWSVNVLKYLDKVGEIILMRDWEEGDFIFRIILIQITNFEIPATRLRFVKWVLFNRLMAKVTDSTMSVSHYSQCWNKLILCMNLLH